MTPSNKEYLASEVLKAAPSLGAIGAWLVGIPLERWVAIAGLVFICIQAVGYLWRLRRDMRIERERVARSLQLDEDHDA